MIEQKQKRAARMQLVKSAVSSSQPEWNFEDMFQESLNHIREIQSENAKLGADDTESRWVVYNLINSALENQAMDKPRDAQDWQWYSTAEVSKDAFTELQEAIDLAILIMTVLPVTSYTKVKELIRDMV